MDKNVGSGSTLGNFLRKELRVEAKEDESRKEALERLKISNWRLLIKIRNR